MINRLFGLLIISLSLLTTSIILQSVWEEGRGMSPISLGINLVVLILGILMVIPDRKIQNNEEEYVSVEEIEEELLKSNHKDK